MLPLPSGNLLPTRCLSTTAAQGKRSSRKESNEDVQDSDNSVGNERPSAAAATGKGPAKDRSSDRRKSLTERFLGLNTTVTSEVLASLHDTGPESLAEVGDALAPNSADAVAKRALELGLHQFRFSDLSALLRSLSAKYHRVSDSAVSLSLFTSLSEMRAFVEERTDEIPRRDFFLSLVSFARLRDQDVSVLLRDTDKRYGTKLKTLQGEHLAYIAEAFSLRSVAYRHSGRVLTAVASITLERVENLSAPTLVSLLYSLTHTGHARVALATAVDQAVASVWSSLPDYQTRQLCEAFSRLQFHAKRTNFSNKIAGRPREPVAADDRDVTVLL